MKGNTMIITEEALKRRTMRGFRLGVLAALLVVATLTTGCYTMLVVLDCALLHEEAG